jgi:hypothetical protein
MAKNSTFTVPPNPMGIYTVSIGTGGGGGSGMFSQTSFGSNVSDSFIDHQITGETITASYYVTHAELFTSNCDSEDVKYGIKKILIGKIAEKLFESSMIEFTQQEQVTEDATMFRARIHVTPDTQVRIIRELKDARKTT